MKITQKRFKSKYLRNFKLLYFLTLGVAFPQLIYSNVTEQIMALTSYSCKDYPSAPTNPSQGYYNVKKVCDYLLNKNLSYVEYDSTSGYNAYIYANTGNDGGTGMIEYSDTYKIKANYMYENSSYTSFLKYFPIYTGNSKYYFSDKLESTTFTIGEDYFCTSITYDTDGNEICNSSVYKHYPIYMRYSDGQQAYLEDIPAFYISDSGANFHLGYFNGTNIFVKEAYYLTSGSSSISTVNNLTFNNIPVFYLMSPTTYNYPSLTFTYKNIVLQSVTPNLYSYKYDSVGKNGLRGYYSIPYGPYYNDYLTIEMVSGSSSSVQVGKNGSNKYFSKGKLKFNIKIVQRSQSSNEIKDTYNQVYTVQLSENIDFDRSSNEFLYSNTEQAPGLAPITISCSGTECLSNPEAYMNIKLMGKNSEYIYVYMWLNGGFYTYNPAVEGFSVIKK